jgi:hypothetical protein
MCRSGIYLGGFLQDSQDTETDLDIPPFLRGLAAKLPFFFLAFGRQGTGAPPAASGRRWRRRFGTRGDRVSGGKQRGDHGDLDGAPTLDRGERRGGWRRAFMAAGSVRKGWWRSDAEEVTGRSDARAARRRELLGGLRFVP